MDWIRFLEENNIHFVTRGPNTKRGEVSIQCPMCGEDDPSEHCGINLTTGKWGCHRDASHRGKSPVTLIKAILGCSHTQARFIVKQFSKADPDTLDEVMAALQSDDVEEIEEKPKEEVGRQFTGFARIKPRGITSRFYKYLTDRGYDNAHEVIERYDLRCALTGRYKDRIILPIRMNNEFIGWTSRALGKPFNAPRYLASSEDVKSVIFNYDLLKEGGRRLFIVEGPFDAMKLDNYCYTTQVDVPYSVTCVFGTSVTLSQIVILRKLVKKFDETWVLFDQGADEPAKELASWINAKVAYLEAHIKDPGEMKEGDMVTLSSKYFNGYISFGLGSIVQATLRNRTNQLAANMMKNNALLTRLAKKP